MKKGTRVYVRWQDIQANLHTDEQIDTAPAESVGWIVRDNRKILELAYCRYRDGSTTRDGICIPQGCIELKEEI